MKKVVGKPVLLDKLDAELVPKAVEAIIADNERAKKAKEARRARREAKRKADPAPPDAE